MIQNQAADAEIGGTFSPVSIMIFFWESREWHGCMFTTG
jgi:hypothetical protein